MNPSTISETAPVTNPAMIQARPALPATLATMPEQMVRVLADLEIAPAICFRDKMVVVMLVSIAC
jgi:hypothetical protein